MKYIVMALKSEVQALVERYKLHKSKLRDYTLFENEKMRLIISGVGVKNAMRATQTLIDFYDISDEDIYINLGICAASKEYWTQTGRTKQVYVPIPNEVWSGDITYIRINGGFMYLVAVIDWHTKAVLAYKLSNSMDATLATDVLQEALSKYPKPKIFNSDQGSQYTSYEHTQLLKKYDIQISMNGKGRSIDNIVIERFFRTLKHSNIYISDYRSIQELKEGIKSYIYKYNFKRFHSSIGYQKPMNLYLDFIKNVA